MIWSICTRFYNIFLYADDDGFDAFYNTLYAIHLYAIHLYTIHLYTIHCILKGPLTLWIRTFFFPFVYQCLVALKVLFFDIFWSVIQLIQFKFFIRDFLKDYRLNSFVSLFIKVIFTFWIKNLI